MSDVCQEIISIDKATRYILGTTFYPDMLYCDSRPARDCAQKRWKS